MYRWDSEFVDFHSLVGKTLTKVHGLEKYSGSVVFETDSGEKYEMLHLQDCCESVDLDDVTGDVDDLIGSEILVAEESSASDPDAREHGTWTFYKLATAKGYVDIRWYGSSNGYYSESVSFRKL